MRYIAKSNSVTYFIEKRLEEEPESYEVKGDAYASFVKFCNSKNLPSVDITLFARRLLQHIPFITTERRTVQRKRVSCWRGIRLRRDGEEE